MKLLLDENPPARLVAGLQLEYLGSTPIRAVGMESATDTEIWTLENAEGFAIVSKDSDFYHRSMAHGAPPKVIMLRVGNMSTAAPGAFVAEHSVALKRFVGDADASALLRAA